MTIIFTDIDGVLNNINKLEWNKKSIHLYNKLCQEFNLKTVVTSTWRTNHTIYQLQNIFWNQEVENYIKYVEIYLLKKKTLFNTKQGFLFTNQPFCR